MGTHARAHVHAWRRARREFDAIDADACSTDTCATESEAYDACIEQHEECFDADAICFAS